MTAGTKLPPLPPAPFFVRFPKYVNTPAFRAACITLTADHIAVWDKWQIDNNIPYCDPTGSQYRDWPRDEMNRIIWKKGA